MTTTTKTTTHATRRPLTSGLRQVWQESVAAHRAMLRLTPYFDQYRQDGR